MKLTSNFLLLASFTATLVEIHAQSGTVNFANGAAQVDAPVLFKGSGTGVTGSDWRVELMVQSNSNLVSIAGPVSFETGSLAGYFFAGSVSVPEAEPGQSATFVLRVFNTTGETSVKSEPITVTLGGGIMAPANLLGLATVEIPSPVALSISENGPQIILSWPKNASNMLLQFSTGFPPAWQNISAPTSTNATSISATLDILNVLQFFRLVAFE